MVIGHRFVIDADAILRAQEFQRQQQEAAEQDRKARELAGRQQREAERTAADQADRMRWSSQHR